jgi:hypothetical protein
MRANVDEFHGGGGDGQLRGEWIEAVSSRSIGGGGGGWAVRHWRG